jgi:hypothetical protein
LSGAPDAEMEAVIVFSLLSGSKKDIIKDIIIIEFCQAV